MRKPGPQTYRDLDIYPLAHRLAVKIHRMTRTALSRLEALEEGRQVRRSAKAVAACIVKGFGRRRYKADFLRFLTYAHASCDETMEHLCLLRDTGSLHPAQAQAFIEAYDGLGRKLNRFIRSVERRHLTQR